MSLARREPRFHVHNAVVDMGVATIGGSRCRFIHSIDLSPMTKPSARFPITRPTSGIRRYCPDGRLSTAVGTMSIVLRPTSMAFGSATRTELKWRPCLAITTQRVNACYQPKAIPGTNKILFVAGAHHAVVGGPLVVLDPSKVHLNPKSEKTSSIRSSA